MQGSSGIGGSMIADLSAASRAAWEADNRADAARLKACYALYRECVHEEASGARDDVRPGYAVVDPFEVCCTHLIAVFPLSSGRAATMVSLSVDLTERYPAVLAALAAGRLDQRAAELLARQMRTVDPAVLSRVQQEAVDAYLAAIEAGERPGEGAVRGMVDEIIARHDADGIRQRREDASRDRGVTVSRGADGMSTVWATLASDEAAVLAEKLDQRAEEFADLAHYSLAERRADALMSLVLGQRGDGSSDSPLRPRVTVIAGPGTADGEPVVQFPRTGDSSIRALLALLGSSAGATLERVDPTMGAADDPEHAQKYRPGAALARAIRLRDGTCRHPGCTRDAEYGDLDHLVPFNHDDPARGGPTLERNNLIFCRRHHRFKTFSGWDYRMAPDGTLTITTPDGKTVVTRPSGPVAAYRREQARAEQAKWDAQQKRTRPGVPAGHPTTDHRTDDAATPTYWHRRAQRVRAERRAAKRGRARPATPPDSRKVPLESQVEKRLAELLEDPPPF